MDLAGRLERTLTLREGAGQVIRLDGLNPGVHLIELRTAIRREVERLIVTR